MLGTTMGAPAVVNSVSLELSLSLSLSLSYSETSLSLSYSDISLSGWLEYVVPLDTHFEVISRLKKDFAPEVFMCVLEKTEQEKQEKEDKQEKEQDK
jgi:hypothetical protein